MFCFFKYFGWVKHGFKFGCTIDELQIYPDRSEHEVRTN
jgi:hypothetical protein